VAAIWVRGVSMSNKDKARIRLLFWSVFFGTVALGLFIVEVIFEWTK
jgi:hypothetical protein